MPPRSARKTPSATTARRVRGPAALVFQAPQHFFLRLHPAPIGCGGLRSPQDVRRPAMLRWIVNITRMRIADLAHGGFALSERTRAGCNDPHAGNDEIEPPACPAAVRAVALRGDRRVVRRDIQIHSVSRRPESLRYTIDSHILCRLHASPEHFASSHVMTGRQAPDNK